MHKLDCIYLLLIVSMVLVVLAHPIAYYVVPWKVQDNWGSRNPETILLWATSIRYLGLLSFVVGLMERVLYAVYGKK